MTKNFRKVLSILLALSLVLGLCPDAAKAVNFSDKAAAVPVESAEAVVSEKAVETPAAETLPAADEETEEPTQPEIPAQEDTQPEATEEPAQTTEPVQENPQPSAPESPAEPANTVKPTEPVRPTVPELDPLPITLPEITEVAMPKQSFTGTANGVDVYVSAPEGAFPEGTLMVLKAVDAAAVENQVRKVVDGDITRMLAVDISFVTPAGTEIEPLKAIEVSMTSAEINADKAAIVHIADAGEVQLVKDVEFSANKATFKSEAFSVYVVVETGDDARLTVEFINGENTIATMIVKKSDIGKLTPSGEDVFNQVIYDPGVGELADNHVFRGWTHVQNYTVEGLESTNVPMTIDDVRADIKAILNEGVHDGDKVTYYAMMFKVVNITFKDEEGVVIKNEGLLTKGDNDVVEYFVNENYTPKTSDQEFQGWFVSSPGEVTDAEGNVIAEGSAIQNETTIKAVKDVILSAKAPKGFWLIFRENGSGASYTSPQFLEGVKPTEPTDPTRFGYTFAGWYTDAACTDGNEFDFDQLLTKTTTIYAKWVENETAGYTVIVWKQNVDGKTYDFAESTSLTGTVGQAITTVTDAGTGNNRYASVNGAAKRWTGFHLDRYDQNVTIKVDGTSVVNVYYNRNEITLTFVYRQNNSWQTQTTMTGLYGQTLESRGYTWPTNRWWYDDYSTWGGYSGAGTRTTFLDAFILSDGGDSQTFYGFAGNGNRNVYWFKQASDGSWPALNSPTNQAQTSNGTFNISDKYNGYHAVSYSTNGTSWTNLGDKNASGYYASVSNYTNLYIRYAPDLYNIQFTDGVYVDGNGVAVEGYSSRGELKVEKDVPYASDTTAYNKNGAKYYAPTFEGFVFEGWYVDDACTQAYTFNTMPEGLQVFAKWVQVQYRVFLHPNVPTSDTSFSMGGQATSFRIDYNESINSITGIRDDYELVGWYTDEACTKVFNFDAFVLNDTTVTTPYDKTQSTETDTYGNPTENTNKDATNNRFWITKKLDLYAKWRSKLLGANGITVVYEAGEGSFSGGGTTYTDPLTYKDLAMAVATTATTPTDTAKKEFSHWAIQKWDGSAFVDTEETVLPGDSFEVLKAYAQMTENEGSTAEDPSYTYTVKLIAVYKDIEEETTTHIDWYANNKTDAVKSDADIKMNEAVKIEPATLFSYDGYKFLGWARYEAGQKPASPTDTTNLWLVYDWENNKFTCDGKEAAQVACDEKNPYHDLYAVWQPEIFVRVTAGTQTVPYNGAEQSYDYTAEGAYKVEYRVGGDGEWTTTKPEGVVLTEVKPDVKGTDVGTYTGEVKVSIAAADGANVLIAEDGKEATATATLVIEKVKVTIKTGSGEKKYDGTALTVAEASITGLQGNDTATVTATGSQTDVGDSPNTYTINWGSTKATNYEITEELGTLTVTTNDNEVTLTAASGEKVYDGKALKDPTVTATGLPEGLTVEATATGSQTNAGNSKNVVNDGYVIKDAEGNDVTANFTKVTKVDGILTVTKAPVTITTGSDTKEYDGTALTKDEATIEGLVNNETATVKATGTITEVGTTDNTYSIDWGTTNKDNYEVTEELGTLEVTKNTAEVKLIAATDSKTYDGKALTNDEVTAEGLPAGFTIEAVAEGTQTNAGSSANVVADGYKILNAEGKDVTANFTNVTKVNGTLTVTKAPVTITTGTATKAYDGTPLTEKTATITGLVNNETATVTATGSQTEVGTTSNTYSIDWGTTNKDNYEVTEKLGTLTVTTTDAEVVLTAASGEKVYDGKALKDPTVTATGLPEGLTVEATATGSQTNAGNSKNVVNDGYVIKDAEGNDVTANFTKVTKVDGTLTVTKAPVTITTGSDSKEYDGTALTKDEATIEGLVNNETATVKATGSQTEVGSSTNTYSIDWGTTNKDNYEVTEELGTLEVTKNTAEVKLIAATDSKTYDGKALTNAEVTAEGLPEGFTIEAKAEGSQTDAGSSANVVADGYKILDADGNDKTANFTNVTKVDGKLTVNPKPVTIKTGSDSKAYDGTALTNDEATIEGLVEGESVTLKATGSQTEVGSSDNTYDITWDNAKESNYTVTDNLGTLTVTTNDAEVVLTAATDSKTYDGKALTNDEVTASGLPEGFTIEAKAEGSQTDAGSSANVVADGYKILDADGNDKTANFTKVTKVDGKLTVNPKAVIITTGSDSKQYDGTALTKDEATIEGLVEGETVTLKATGSQTEVGSSDNTYEITWDNAKESNYTVTENLGTLEVTKNASAVKLIAGSDEKVYDGKELTNDEVTPEGLPEGFTVEATTEGGQTDAGESANKVAAGYKILNADGEDKTANFTNVTTVDGTLKVTPKAVTIKTGSDTKEYDGTALTKDEATIEGLVEGETVTLKATGSQTEVGSSDNTYEITWDNAKESNYTVTEELGTLEVTKNTAKVTITAGSDSKKYDGTAITSDEFEYEGLPEGFTVVAVTEGSQTNAGSSDNAIVSYQILDAEGNDKTENFTNVVLVNGTLEVTKRALTLTSATDEKVYDGTALTNDEVTIGGDGLADTDTITFDVTGSQTYVGSSANTFTYEISKKADATPAFLKKMVKAASFGLMAADDEEPAEEASVADNYDITVVEGTLTVTDDVDDSDVIVKTHDGEEYGLGETVEFIISVTNIYDEPKTITIEEIEGVTFTSEHVFENVAPGMTVVATAEYVVTEEDLLAGTFKNTATATFSDVDKSYEGEDEVDLEDPKPHVTITKEVTNEPADGELYKEGETIEYLITVENDGNLTVYDLKVTDELTGDEWTIDELAPGASEEFKASYKVTPEDAAAGKVLNVATGTGTTKGDDPEVVPGEKEVPVKTPEIPKTSDDSQIFLWASMLTLSIAGIGFTMNLKKREEESEAEA